jgi:hypothetical protein
LRLTLSLIEQFLALFRAAWTGKVTAMSGIFASLTLEYERIRLEQAVIKGGIFPPNYS